ncbi:MAG: DUF4304 domain-containing protein [Clostridia bacterium]|nr:DUF4304 domain-containing protein [Clostridia bacterium]
MANRDIMLSALKEITFPILFKQGFTGKYPHFRRKSDNCIELVSFQTNKYGGSFTVEISAVFPNEKNKNYNLYDGVTEETFGTEATNKRYRLPGMFDGWFYYRDVYRKRSLLFGNLYTAVSEKKANDFIVPKGYKLVQKFDKNTAIQICNEINKQLTKSEKWLKNFEKQNR